MKHDFMAFLEQLVYALWWY